MSEPTEREWLEGSDPLTESYRRDAHFAAPAAAPLVEQIAAVLAEHESLLGSDNYTRCACGVVTVNLGGLRAHVASQLARLVEREKASAWDEGLAVGMEYGGSMWPAVPQNPYARD